MPPTGNYSLYHHTETHGNTSTIPTKILTGLCGPDGQRGKAIVNNVFFGFLFGWMLALCIKQEKKLKGRKWKVGALVANVVSFLLDIVMTYVAFTCNKAAPGWGDWTIFAWKFATNLAKVWMSYREVFDATSSERAEGPNGTANSTADEQDSIGTQGQSDNSQATGRGERQEGTAGSMRYRRLPS